MDKLFECEKCLAHNHRAEHQYDFLKRRLQDEHDRYETFKEVARLEFQKTWLERLLERIFK